MWRNAVRGVPLQTLTPQFIAEFTAALRAGESDEEIITRMLEIIRHRAPVTKAKAKKTKTAKAKKTKAVKSAKKTVKAKAATNPLILTLMEAEDIQPFAEMLLASSVTDSDVLDALNDISAELPNVEFSTRFAQQFLNLMIRVSKAHMSDNSGISGIGTHIAIDIMNQYSVAVGGREEESEEEESDDGSEDESESDIEKEDVTVEEYIDALRDGDLTLVAAYYLSNRDFATLRDAISAAPADLFTQDYASRFAREMISLQTPRTARSIEMLIDMVAQNI